MATIPLAETHFFHRAVPRAVSTRALFALLFTLIAIPQLLLWRFLGFGLPALAVGAVAIAALGVAATRALTTTAFPLRTLAPLAALALALCLLGGEGRFFYANPDWQVRDAVLRDLVVYPWPWVYAGGPAPLLLRIPAGVYLLPALVGKAGGYHAAELAMLAQNAALLTAVLALGATLFEGLRARVIALAVVLGFSGLDLLGTLVTGQRLSGHLEWWSVVQYSAHVTQIFWVPQHALAGWIGALLYLLWKDGRIALAGLLAPLPLLALWSPLALIGLLPFAAHAALTTLARRGLKRGDVLLPGLATLIAVPGLLYLAADSGTVGGRPYLLPFILYALFVVIEVVPFLLAAVATARGARFGGITAVLVAAVLLGLPYLQIGASLDFAMRASIPAVAILSVQLADLLARPDRSVEIRAWRLVTLAALAIGAVTPLTEIRRAIVFPTAPAPRCSYLGIVPGGAATYIAPLDRLAAPIRPAAPAHIRPHDPTRCWDTGWQLP